jgi:hypothetical protein
MQVLRWTPMQRRWISQRWRKGLLLFYFGISNIHMPSDTKYQTLHSKERRFHVTSSLVSIE